VSDKAFDPGHPLVLQYTVKVAMDLVNNFNIDGIHYDYIRFTANDQRLQPHQHRPLQRPLRPDWPARLHG